MSRSLRLAGSLLLAVTLFAGCSSTEPERRPDAPTVERQTVVVVGGIRARAAADPGANYETWPVRYSLSELPSSAHLLNLAYEGFGVVDPDVPVPDPTPEVADVVLMWIGEENILDGTSAEILSRGIERLVNDMDTADQRFVLATLPSWDDQGLDAATLAPFNAAITELADRDPRIDLADVAGASPDGSDAAAIAGAFAAAYPGG